MQISVENRDRKGSVGNKNTRNVCRARNKKIEKHRDSYLVGYIVWLYIYIEVDRIEANRTGERRPRNWNWNRTAEPSACVAAQRQRSDWGAAEEELRRHGIGYGYDGAGAAAAVTAGVLDASVGAQAHWSRSGEFEGPAVQDHHYRPRTRTRHPIRIHRQAEPAPGLQFRKHSRGATR